MDGLLVLLLIGWVISQMSKKNKKTKSKAALNADKRKAAASRYERAAQLFAGHENQNVQLNAKKHAAAAATMSEGESSSSYVPMEEVFRGSMQVDSTEGECICDPELEHEREPAVASESVYAREIGREPVVDFSARGMMQGIVMSEILTRPAQRTRRR